jgi:hypothetical protein
MSALIANGRGSIGEPALEALAERKAHPLDKYHELQS